MSSDRPDELTERDPSSDDDPSAPPSDGEPPEIGDDAPSDAGLDRADEDDPSEPDSAEEGLAELDEVDVKDLLRKALAPPTGGKEPNITERVQRRIRERSDGRFFGTRWSTSSAPATTFLVTSLLMLLVVLLAWLFLSPTGVEILSK
ncbi:MAG: hypothetical protein JRI68_01475 [Deltaproteobacteria bacterium]|nr:hypothetical protein [Deltaproteobacteria bacterium]